MAFTSDETMKAELIELREDLNKYRPGNAAYGLYDVKGVQFPENLCIGLFGSTGCGKTSLINSLKFAVSESFRKGKWFPTSSSEHPGGHTIRRRKAELVSNIFVVDNRGWEDLTNEGMLEELEAQIDGKRGYTDPVVWGTPTCAGDVDGITNAALRQDPIGCIVFVVSARHTIERSVHGLLHVISRLHEKLGRFPVAVITNVDCDRQPVDKLRATLQKAGVTELFEVANITPKKTTLEICYQHSLLSFLERCMTDGDAAVAFKQNWEREQTKKNERAETQDRQNERRFKDYQALEGKKIVVLSGGLITGATAVGATVGMALGPVGSVIGAGIGAGVGLVSLVIGKIVKDA